MDILKKENTIVWILLYVLTFGFSNILLAKYLKLLKKGEWYTKWYYWFFGIIAFMLPVFIMLIVLNYQMTIRLAKELGVGGSELYASPYFLITCIIVPLFGWTMLLSTYVFISLHIFIKLATGKAEIYI